MVKYIVILYLLCCSTLIFAQTTSCPAFVQTALDFADLACTDTGRNEACYGNGLITVEATDVIKFDEVGDIVPITSFTSMRLSEMRIDDESWGISLMRIQANLPDTLPGQNVQFVLFGDVEIEDKGTISTQLSATAISGVNVRSRPTTTENNVIDSLANGEDVTAVGRLEDSSWIQIRLLVNENVVFGWVSADFLRSDNEFTELNVIDPNQISYGAMQAFILKTGIGDSACATAPDSGLLIQTPEGAGKINLLVNEVTIEVGSTILLRSQPNDFLYVSVLEGQAIISALGVPVTAPAGVTIRIPMTEDSTPEPLPSIDQNTSSETVESPIVTQEVIEYSAEDFETIPINILEQDIEIATESVAPIITGIQNLAGGVLVGDDTRRPIFVNFINPDGDEVTTLEMSCASTTHPRGCSVWGFGTVPLNESSLVSGDWSGGQLTTGIRCITARPEGINTTVDMYLVDSAGLTSGVGSINFDCVAP